MFPLSLKDRGFFKEAIKPSKNEYQKACGATDKACPPPGMGCASQFFGFLLNSLGVCGIIQIYTKDQSDLV